MRPYLGLCASSLGKGRYRRPGCLPVYSAECSPLTLCIFFFQTQTIVRSTDEQAKYIYIYTNISRALRNPPPCQFYDFFRLGCSDRVHGSLKFFALGFYNFDSIGIRFGSIWKPFGCLLDAFWMPFGPWDVPWAHGDFQNFIDFWDPRPTFLGVPF